MATSNRRTMLSGMHCVLWAFLICGWTMPHDHHQVEAWVSVASLPLRVRVPGGPWPEPGLASIIAPSYPATVASATSTALDAQTIPTDTTTAAAGFAGEARDEEDEEDDLSATHPGWRPRERYVVTNRFAVRPQQQAKFEKRWATRKSRLATLPGFKYFHLMRRVNLSTETGETVYDAGDSDGTAQENYISLTVWDQKRHFTAWRKGDAFKEAHGGTSIGAFLSTLLNSAQVLRGPPRPAFYDGLLVQSSPPEQIPDTVGGWRQVPADGVHTLPAEGWIVLEKYYLASVEQQAVLLEQAWAQKRAPLTDHVVASTLMRRDVPTAATIIPHGGRKASAGDEPNYVGLWIFGDRASWQSFLTTTTASSWMTDVSSSSLPWTRPPQRVCYEGTLVIKRHRRSLINLTRDPPGPAGRRIMYS